MLTTLHIVDAFTKTPGQGNRAGVVLDAATLTPAQMQAIAAFAGYSETAFVLPPKTDDHDIHIRYFTPTAEVPICGHATIATHFLRAQNPATSAPHVRMLTGAGILPVDISGSGANASVTMTQGTPEFGTPIDGPAKTTLLTALGITASDLLENLPIQIVSTGHSKVMIPLTNRNTLNALTPDVDALKNLSQHIGCNGFFPFVPTTEPEFCTHGRMFAPAIGITEDPVTGNANGPAGAYLHHHSLIPTQNPFTYSGHQGEAMGKFGTVTVTLTPHKTAPLTVQVGGNATLAGTREYTP